MGNWDFESVIHVWRATGHGEDVRPSFRRLAQDSQHVVSRNAIGASNDGGQALDRFWEDGDVLVDAFALGLNWSHDDRMLKNLIELKQNVKRMKMKVKENGRGSIYAKV